MQSMKDNLGRGFGQAVSELVSWFLQVEGGFDTEELQAAVEEVLAEHGKLSDLALQTFIRQRYARKKGVALQTPAIRLNDGGIGSSKLVQRYRFAPLASPSHIRLFKFRRFITLGQEIYYSCEIVHANLEDRPSYLAFSYAWGDLTRVAPLLVGDSHYLMVTINLLEVLFRYSGSNTPVDKGNTSRLMWTDQLCINQYDSRERSHQVELMKRIYTQADETNLWLGEENESAKQAFDLIKCFECIDASAIDLKIFSLTGLTADEIRTRFFAIYPQAVGNIPPRTDTRWRSLFELLGRPWFSRLWTFQEAILSSSIEMGAVHCGQMRCNFFHLFLARTLLFIDWDVEKLPSGLQGTKNIMQYYLFRKFDSLPPLSFTVWQIGSALVSFDPRDHIYGMLGVQNSKEDLGLSPDYSKSVPEVYIDFTRRCIEKDGCLRVLEYHKESKTRNILNLPTWVPDWSVEAAVMPFDCPRDEHDKQTKFQASVGLPYLASASESTFSSSLTVKGRIIDHVVSEIDHDFEIGTPIQIEQYFSVTFRVKLWVMIALQGIERGILREGTIKQVQAALIRTLTADGFNDEVSTNVVSKAGTRLDDGGAVKIYDELERLRELSVNGLPDEGVNTAMHHKFWKNTEACRGRRLAVVAGNWFILGPSQVRKGDAIAILHGSSVPWVLRLRVDENSTAHYEVVGQCFVDGVMYGEAVEWREDEADTFVLV